MEPRKEVEVEKEEEKGIEFNGKMLHQMEEYEENKHNHHREEDIEREVEEEEDDSLEFDYSDDSEEGEESGVDEINFMGMPTPEEQENQKKDLNDFLEYEWDFDNVEEFLGIENINYEETQEESQIGVQYVTAHSQVKQFLIS